MSLNVMNTYLKFNRKRLISYSKIILEKNYNKNIFENLLDTYINCRYVDIPDNISAKFINKELVKKAEELSKEEEVLDIKLVLSYFPFIYYLDSFLKKDIDVTIEKINDFRKKNLKLDNLDSNFKTNLVNDRKRIEIFLDNFDSKVFSVSLVKTNIKNLYDTNLYYDIKIPKLYSEYAINNVYNRGIVLENRLFVNYYMVAVNVLKDILNLDYNYYIVSFSNSLFDKEDKLKRLFNIIDSDVMKDRIILKVYEDEFLEYRDYYLKYIKDGYKFVICLNSDSKIKNDTIIKVFSYMIDNSNILEVK